ncbi:MAG: hypothetical protein NT040_05020 [Bacteroidetes bacterium]|nr:hypothetical protein [Bacteroidota bacterium]
MKTTSIFIVILLLHSSLLFSQVAINTDGSPPDPTAMLDVSSTNRGLLIPRISTAARNLIPSPATGLLIYNTDDNQFNYYNGSYWYQLGGTPINSAIGTLSPGGGVAISVSPGALPDNSAMLDVSNPSRGVLIPRISTAAREAMTSPATGLITYNTDANILFFYNGSQWITLCTVSTGIAGAAGSQPAVGVAVNAGNSGPDPSAMLDISSADKGLLIPRLSSSEREALLPVTGLAIYNTTTGTIEYNNGTTWCQVDSYLSESPVAGTHIPTTSQIEWHWTSVARAAGYKWNTIDDMSSATDLGNTTTFLETGLTCGASYTRYVWAYSGCGLVTPATLTQSTQLCSLCPTSITVDHLATNGVAPVDKTVTYGIVTNIPGETSKCWISSNLGADHQAISVDDATEASAGWYWQFNRKQGYKHDGTYRTPNTPWISGISENSDWITASDPCNIELGTTWRLPTYTEWNNVNSNGGWTNWNDPWGSGLKLHAAGYLHGADGSLDYCGLNGTYQSSTQGDADNGGYLNFLSGSSYMNYFSKAYAFSVRCMKDPGIPVPACGTSITVSHLATGGVAPVDKTATYDIVTNIAGESTKCWISSNLGSDHQAANVDDATFESAGWYWQFNRKQGYSNDWLWPYPSWTITGISENSDWQTANDPCTHELGSGWRIPTYTEWVAVSTAGSWANWNGPWNSGLKLHAAGLLNYSDGVLYNRGSGGFYWSNTQVNDGEGWDLGFGANNCDMGGGTKPFGFSVRCLKDPTPIPFTCGSSFTVNHLIANGIAPVDKSVTYSTVNNITGEPSKCWISSNLGSDHQATNFDDATEASAGWYWQFNRKQGYKNDGTNLTPSWIGGSNWEDANWEAANDPCTLELGSAWRIPTYTEWDNVRIAGNWTDWNGPWNSGLKLHAAGYLDSYNGFLIGQGTYGQYWGSNQNYDHGSGWNMYFSGYVCFQYALDKTYGNPLRCLSGVADPVALPTVTTTEISNIAGFTATGGGNVTTDGGAPVTYGICRSTSPQPTINDVHTVDGGGTGVFTSELTVLTPLTTYYVRAYATNSYGTAYGEEVTFNTFSPSYPCIGLETITVNHPLGLVAPVSKTVTYGTVTNIPGEPSKCWITSNLGADHQAVSVIDATEASSGWYWQFNTKQGYKLDDDGVTRTPNSAWDNGANFGTSDWIPANDPCTIELGADWRIPTNTEWSNAGAGINGNWTNWNGPWNSGLKIHAAGYLRNGDGLLIFRGSMGRYWSRNYDNYSYGLSFITNSYQSSVGTTIKACGLPLRCIK